jgi:enoyl-CoA hydratase/carnithine racemase
MAARVAALSPQAVGFSKTLIHQARNGVPRSAALALERERFVDLFDGADQREGVNAFLEKRTPRWQIAQGEHTTSSTQAAHAHGETQR